MKKLSMIVACILSGSVTTYAQSDIPPHLSIRGMLNHSSANSKLNLTVLQKVHEFFTPPTAQPQQPHPPNTVTKHHCTSAAQQPSTPLL